MVAMAAPWWWWVYHRMSQESLGDSELTGSALRIQWFNVLYMGYLYRTPYLILPWVVFLIPAIALLREQSPYRKGQHLLGWVVLTMILIMSFGSRRHAYYMLPVLAPMCLMLGAGGVSAWSALKKDVTTERYQRVWAALLMGHVIAGVATLAGCLWHFREPWLPAYSVAALVLIALVGLWGVGWSGWRRSPRPTFYFVSASGLMAALWVYLGFNGSIWTSYRFVEADLGRSLHGLVMKSTPIASWGYDPGVIVYYARRRVKECATLDEVARLSEESPDHRLALLIHSAAVSQLSERFSVKVLKDVRDEDDSMSLVELSESKAVEPGFPLPPALGPPAPAGE
jgi:hypothetical protein